MLELATLLRLSKIFIVETGEGAFALLRILSDPLDHISSNVKIEDLENVLTPWTSTSGVNGQTMARLIQFWDLQPHAADVFPEGTVTYDGNGPYVDIAFGMRYNQHLFYQVSRAFAYTVHGPLLERVTRIALESVGAPPEDDARMADVIDLSCFSNADWIEIKRTSALDSADVQTLEAWIMASADSDCPICGVEFVNYGDGGKPLFERVRNSGIVDYVSGTEFVCDGKTLWFPLLYVVFRSASRDGSNTYIG